ncbi:MAG: carboxypeptidase regulatory-like domain-containing protein [Planctomycetes bacterium]|nr:carboxypeptidase regulatory-like domain-containing protein [Planctomycetota bacterium]
MSKSPHWRVLALVLSLVALLGLGWLASRRLNQPSWPGQPGQREAAATSAPPETVADVGATPKQPTSERIDERRVRGTVLRESGELAPGARIYAVPEQTLSERELKNPESTKSETAPDAMTDSTGEFELSSDRIQKPILALLPRDGFVFAPAWQPSVPLRVLRHNGITLRVVERKLGAPPVIGASVLLRRLPLYQHGTWKLLPEHRDEYRALARIECVTGTTDTDGNARFPGVPPGVFAAAIEISPTQRMVISPLILGSEESVVLPVGEPARITLSVLRRDTREPIPPATACVMDLDPPYPSVTAWAQADDRGVILLEGPFQGYRRIHSIIRAKGFATESIVIQEIVTESSAARTVMLEPGRNLTSQLLDSEGMPVAGALVLAESPANRVIDRDWSDESGKFEIPDAPTSREMWITISKPGFVPSKTTAEIGKPLPDPIILHRAGRILLHIEGLPTKADTPDRSVTVWTQRYDPSGGHGVPQFHDVSDRCESPVDLPGDEPGRYLVRVQCSKRAPVNLYADVENEKAAHVTAVLETGTTLRGRVLAGRDRAPIANATIMVLVPRPPAGTMTPPSGISTFTDVDGRFELRNAAAGELELFIHDEERAGRYVQLVVPPSLEHDAGVIELFRYSRVTGQIESEIELPDDVHVKVRDAGNLVIDTIGVKKSGTFSLPGIVKGSYSFSVGVHSDLTFEAGRRAIKIGDDEDKKVVLKYGAASLRCRLAPPLEDPAEGWELIVRRKDTLEIVGARDGNGDRPLELRGMPAGLVQLIVRSWGGRSSILAQREAVLSPGWNDLTFSRSKSELRISALDRTGEPIAGATVTTFYGSRVAEYVALTTNAKGQVIARDLTPGRYTLGIIKHGFERVPRTQVEIRDGSTEEVELRVARESPLAVLLSTPRREPVSGATVRVDPLGGIALEAYFQDSDGRGVSRFRSLGAGMHKIRVLPGPNHFPAESTVELPAEKALEVPITVRRLGAVRIRVIDKSGASVAGAAPIVQVDGVDGDSNSWLADGICESATGAAETGNDGVLEIRRLPEGKATIAVEGAAPWLASIEPDKTTEVLLRQN